MAEGGPPIKVLRLSEPSEEANKIDKLYVLLLQLLKNKEENSYYSGCFRYVEARVDDLIEVIESLNIQPTHSTHTYYLDKQQ